MPCYEVIASKISKKKIFYKCPECKKIHNHGNETNSLKDRVTYRLSHCNKFEKYNDIKIIINDETTRLRN